VTLAKDLKAIKKMARAKMVEKEAKGIQDELGI
jgi:hypothetical protein